MADDPKVTITVYRSTVDDALTCLAAFRDDETEPDRYRAAYAAAHEELAEALREVAPVAGDVVVHRCPPDGYGAMPCCGRTPFEVPRTDRFAATGMFVTCGAAAPASGGVVESSPLTAEEATPDCVLRPKVWAPGGSPAEKLASLWAQPHGGACTCRDCTARDEAEDTQPPARIQVRHDPGALMEEPDLHPKTFDPEDERRADDAHMAAMEAQMEHDAEQGEGGAR